MLEENEAQRASDSMNQLLPGGSGLCSKARRCLYHGDKVRGSQETVSPSLECSLHLQSRWFLVSSKPGRHSQAMPPLGVSRQMWAQPWFLFMQFIPSKREKEAKKSSRSLLVLVCGVRGMAGVGWGGGNRGKPCNKNLTGFLPRRRCLKGQHLLARSCLGRWTKPPWSFQPLVPSHHLRQDPVPTSP